MGRVMAHRRARHLAGNDTVTRLREPEIVELKGADEPVAAQRLLGMEERRRATGRAESNLVGRRWELSALEGLLDRVVDGHGAVVDVVVERTWLWAALANAFALREPTRFSYT